MDIRVCGILPSYIINKYFIEFMEEIKTSTPQQNNLAIPGAIVIAGLAIAAAVYFGGNNPNTYAVQPGTANTKVVLDPITEADHIIGNPNAKIIIVEYSDTECPYCKNFHESMNQVMNEYGKDGQVAWAYRHFPLPFHTKAPKEAEATECVNKLGGNEKFWEYLNKIFEITPANNGLDPAELPKLAVSIGIDETAFNACLNSGEMKSIVDAGIASGQKAGVSGTPHSLIVVKGKVVDTINGAQPFEAVKAQIDALLK